MNSPREEWRLDTRRLGRRVLVYDRVGSTNSLTAEFATDSANDGLVLLADEQTAGRGQHGRGWTCPPGAGVLLSVLLFPPAELRRPAVLTAWAAVSDCETIRKATNLQTKIKWPNDVLIRGRKVCGILTETRSAESAERSVSYTVCGIGLNVNQSAASFAEAGLPDAGSLAQFAGSPFDCGHIARSLIQELDEQYDCLCRGDLATLESCWKWRIGLLGKPVIAECHDANYRGRLLELSFATLELAAGEASIRLSPELVRHLHCTSSA